VHQLIFHTNIDLCLKNDFETHNLQPAVTTIHNFDSQHVTYYY